MVSTSTKETEMRTNEDLIQDRVEERRKDIRRSKSKYLGNEALREAYIEGIIPFKAFMDGSIEVRNVESKWIRENRTDAD